MSHVFVIGHKNPDTDSICSAIGYAHFLRETKGVDAYPARCGEINPRTRHVLEEAGLEPPRMLMDVRPTAGRICRKEVIGAHPEESFYSVYRRMQQHGLRAIPVQDDQGFMVGLLSLLDLLQLLLPAGDDRGAEPRRVETSLARIRGVLGGRFIHEVEPGRDETLKMIVAAMSADTFKERMQGYKPEEALVVTGNRPTVQRMAIEYGVRCLVITGGCELDEALKQLVRDRGVCVLGSPLDTATTTLLIRTASMLGPAIKKNFIWFAPGSLVRSIRPQVEGHSQELYPVLDEERKLVGVFSKTDLLNPPRTKIIMVDHNEMSQAVKGLEDAELLEVIDHHRVGGGLTTSEPIRFINDPVGSTCTIIARFMHQADYRPPSSIGRCLVSGIVADTLNLTSPTTTNVDREMLNWLAEVCDFEVAALAHAFFAAGSLLQKLEPAAALESDCKSYTENGWSFAVSQIEEIGTDLFMEHKEALIVALENMVEKKRLDFACLMLTDITHHVSLLLCAGEATMLDSIDYPREDSHLFLMDGVVSRKKQLLPHLSQLADDLHKA